MNKYFKNFILCGDIDHHCLLCKETFQLITDIEKHIRWEKHRRSLKDQDYLPKFKKEFIFKFGNNYYCELCNYVATNLTLVTEHIRTEKHKVAKINPKTIVKKPIGQHDSGYVIIDKVILNKYQWHCIFDKKCLICGVGAKKFDEHVSSQEHVIKLIQCETKYKDDRYYRMINNHTYQCFTCKKIFTNETYTDHWINTKCENNEEVDIKKLQEAITSKDDTITDDIKMTDLEKKLVGTLQEFFYVNEKKNIVACKHCNTSLNLNFKDMIEHMKNKHDDKRSASEDPDKALESPEEEVVYREVADNGKRRSELSQYGKEHRIKLNFNGSKGFCNICSRYLSAHKRIFKEHVKGALHKGHLEIKGGKNPKNAHKISPFRKQEIHSQAMYIQYSPEMGGFWINSEFCIDVNSFFFLYVIENDPHFIKTKCLLCDEIFPQGKERDHCVTLKHSNKFNATKVVKIEGEFIREILPNYYHCGFCNQTLPFWETVEKHVKSMNHTFDKVGKLVSMKAFEYWRNFSPSSIHIKAKNSDDFYLKLMLSVYGYSQIRIR